MPIRVSQRGPTEPTQPILQPPLCNCHGTAFGRLFVVSIEYVCFHLCFWHFFLIEKENFICYSSTKTHNLCMWLWVIEFGAGAGIWPIEKRKMPEKREGNSHVSAFKCTTKSTIFKLMKLIIYKQINKNKIPSLIIIVLQ